MSSSTGTGRRPVSTLTAASLGQMLTDPAKTKADGERMHPDKGMGHGLGVARVTNIDYEEFYITLRTMTGVEQDFERVPVPMTWPGAGNRHFFGAMPEVGDYCVVGWMTQEGTSSKGTGTMTPVILSWIMPGVWPGREWVTTASFTDEEHTGAAEVNNELLLGIFERVRHKLRHIQPGNIVASSSQGSDFVLDEGVTLANRRGNEIRLRDEDQTFLTRALQQYHAMAGARIYGGMVQRDANLLPTSMVSDGKEWDSLNQTLGGEPLSEDDFGPDTKYQEGHLIPPMPLARSLDDFGNLKKPLVQVNGHLDPYTFLRNGGFIDDQGAVITSDFVADAVYGGKPIFRVAQGGKGNAAINPGAQTLTEYRIELAHTSDGRLPVTEQTDLFDADRLPPSDPDTEGTSPNAPYIEMVMGSVVGNDPFSASGREQYGIPLVPQVISNGSVSPGINAAVLQGSDPTPLGEHAATLFRLTPFIGGASPTWWSVNKQGQFKASFGGKVGEASVEASVLGDMMLAVQGKLELDLQGGIHFITRSRASLAFESTNGPVSIVGGGSVQGAEGAMARQSGTDGGQNLPSVTIEAKTSARIMAARELLLKGNSVKTDGSSVVIQGSNEVEIKTSKRLKTSAEDATHSISGRCQESYTGPKLLLPTNAPLHDQTYTPNYPGIVAKKVTFQMGDREEMFFLGNHTTQILVGNLKYSTLAGTFTAEAAASKVELGPTGAQVTALVGNIGLSAPTGSISMQAMASAEMRALAGPAIVAGSTMVYLGAPISGPDVGPIIVAGSLEPFTGLPFLTWGMGAKNHIVGP